MIITPHEKRLDIQGLRAIAVLAVVVFHTQHTWLPGGFIGVDVFFVLSGYLITGVLIRPMEAGKFSIGDFYYRRIRRLFPALFTVMAFAMLMGFLFFPPTLLIEQVESQFFATLFASNFYFADKTDYFDLQVDLMPLLHTWSLGVEEQFYLLFPPILFALFKWGRKILWPALFVMALISLFYSQKWLDGEQDLAFYSPGSRAFELLIGALVVGAERHIRIPEKLGQIAGVGALGILGLSLIFINDRSPFPGFLALVPTLATATLLLTRTGVAKTLLSLPPMVRIGDISYSLYLWHWPLLVFAGFLFPGSFIADLIAVGLSFGAALLSYKYIEQPFLQRPPVPVWPFGGAVMATSIGLCLAIYLNDGVPARFSPEHRVYLEASNDYNHDRKECHMRSDRPKAYDELCVYGAPNTPPSYAVWGDSHGTELAMVLGEELAAQNASLKSITMSGCPASYSPRKMCTEQVNSTLEAIKNDPDMKTILLTSNLHGHSELTSKKVEGIKKTSLELQAAGKNVIIVYPIPTFDFDPPSILAHTSKMGGRVENVGLDRRLYEQRSGHVVDEFDAFTKEHNIGRLRPHELLCDDDKCYAYRDKVGVLYYNQGHLSLTGAGILTDQFVQSMIESDPSE